VPVKFHSDSENKKYYNCFHEAVQQGVALSYRFFKREKNEWYVQVAFSIPKETVVGYNGVIGVDVNYGLFATTEVDRNLNYTGFKNYEFDPEDLSSDQMKDFLGNTIKDIVQRAKESDKSITIEDLDLSNKKSGDFKQTNRKVSMIEYAVFKQMMVSRCLKEGVYLKIVNPAFTSIIGRYKYAKRYGLSIHNAAALVIARRIKFGIKEKVPVQLACILHRGEADKWDTIYRYKHHWSHWKFLHKNLANCLAKVNSVDGCAVDMNKLTVRFNPIDLSFIDRSDGKIAISSFL
jgi:IS605 OrfB family transposase